MAMYAAWCVPKAYLRVRRYLGNSAVFNQLHHQLVVGQQCLVFIDFASSQSHSRYSDGGVVFPAEWSDKCDMELRAIIHLRIGEG